MKRTSVLLACLPLLVVAACGDDDGFTCNLDAATQLAASDWPISRHDPANTGRIDDTSVGNDPPTARCIFPSPADPETPAVDSLIDCTSRGSAITTTVVVGGSNLVLATQDGRIRSLNHEGVEAIADTPINLAAPLNTPLLGVDGTVFITTTGGLTRRYAPDSGELLFSATFFDDIVVAPNIGPDGVIYAGTISGQFQGVCTNGAPRFQVALGAISVPAAVTADPNDAERSIVLAAGDNGRVQGFDDLRGTLMWSFFTAGRLNRSAVVIDESQGIFIVPDSTGRIYAASVVSGQPRRGDGSELLPYRAARCTTSGAPCSNDAECATDEVCRGELITAAAALGTNHLYVITEGPRSETGQALGPGSLYAFSLDFAGGGADWSWTLPQAGQSRSSPVVASRNGRDVVVFAADRDCDSTTCGGGVIGAVSDGELLWQVELPDSVGTASPSIRRDGQSAVIYIGTAGGKLYEVR